MGSHSWPGVGMLDITEHFVRKSVRRSLVASCITNKSEIARACISFKQQMGDVPPKLVSQIGKKNRRTDGALTVSSGLRPPHTASGPCARRTMRKQLLATARRMWEEEIT
jgi:hypothetical protein